MMINIGERTIWMSGWIETTVEYVIERAINNPGVWVQWCATDLASMYDDLEHLRSSHDGIEFRVKKITTVTTSEILA